MVEPKITIGIPAYSQADSLLDAMDSALDQTVPCEIIVVIDGSPDRSLEFARSYEKRGIKVINQINKGLASARNTAIMNMTGDYFIPLDSDDELLPNCAEKVIAKAKETDADVIGLSFQEFGISNARVILKDIPTIEDFKIGNHLGYCSAIKRSVLLEVGGYSPKMTWGYEDYALWFDLLKRKKKFVTIQEPLWLYRTKNESMITEAIKHHEVLMEQIKKDNAELF